VIEPPATQRRAERAAVDRRLDPAPDAAVPIAAGIFLDVFNVFLLALDLFGGERD
jgi:hypothetical protein